MLDWLLSLPLAGSTEFGLLSLVSLIRVTHSTPSILLGYLFDDSSLADLFLIYRRHLLASNACFRAQRSLRLLLKICVLLRCAIGWVLWVYRYNTAVKFGCTTILLFRRSLSLIVVEYLYSWLLRVKCSRNLKDVARHVLGDPNLVCHLLPFYTSARIIR